MPHPSSPRPWRARPIALACAALALAGGAVACEDAQVPMQDPATLTFDPSLGVNLGASTRTASGLYYQDVIVGGGAAADTGRIVGVYYRGSLANGRQFDARLSSTGQPFSFTLGRGTVIRGWEEGLRGMRVGGRRRLVIPPALAYGDRTAGQIPAGSVLVFDVDLVSVTTPPTTTPST